MSCTITLAVTGTLHDYQSIHLWHCMCLRMFLIHLCTEKACHMKKDTQHFSPYKENFFPKKHSDCNIFHLIVSSHTEKQSVQNCVLPCANLHVITLYQSWHNALQQKHCRYMPHTRVMLIQRRDNGGVRGTRQFLMCFLNLTWMKKPFMDFDALCPSSDLLTKLQK
jgi:hypothetical protein